MSVTFIELKEREEICEKVLGLSRMDNGSRKIDYTFWMDPDELEAFEAGDTSVLFETPDFITYEEFGTIVEAMKEKGYEVDAMFDGIDKQWEVCFGKRMGQDPTWTAYHPNLTTAAAKAALDTVEEK